VRLDKWLPISHDAATWLPPPILPAAIALVVALRVGIRERWAWAVAGATFAVLTFLTWGTGHPLTLLLVPIAAPVTMEGAWLGNRIARMLENPVAPDVRLIVPLLGLVFAQDDRVRLNLAHSFMTRYDRVLHIVRLLHERKSPDGHGCRTA